MQVIGIERVPKIWAVVIRCVVVWLGAVTASVAVAEGAVIPSRGMWLVCWSVQRSTSLPHAVRVAVDRIFSSMSSPFALSLFMRHRYPALALSRA